MIYAIQQIFDIRVGSSAASPGLKTSFTNDELEQDLGRQLFEKHPFKSLFFVHEGEVAFGKRWYLSRWSKVPGPVIFNESSTTALSCKITTEAIELESLILLKFRGKFCPLWKLAKAWDRVGVMKNFPVEYEEKISNVPVGEEWDSPWFVTFDYNRGVGGFSSPDISVRSFEEHYKQDETISVLNIAHTGQQILTTHAMWWNIGLVLKPRNFEGMGKGFDQYERIGITVWRSGVKLDESYMEASQGALCLSQILALHKGKGQSWQVKSGHIG
ncbi:hypothetical protein DHEL01_v208635 [Diaporthe helianthi]|uniref:Uncharacterized protein n=1 Tax=Diaporthe helianthi TaxID=158607 RepID=A0A2P5HRT2_DIAHE|nr:hypothetical protein DHEL01_v208635 [Diaporthe helianthi]